MFKVIAIVSVILGFVIFYFILSIIRRQNEVMKWQQARIKAEIDTLENERRRIASDLHDELGPMLSAVKLQINHLEPSDESEIIALERSSAHIDEIIQRFRDISYNLLPNTLIRKGLVKAVEEFINKLNGAHRILIDFTSMELTLPPDKEINLYRIIQEIVHNTIKHARASKLLISIETPPGKLLLKTTDDGIGFNYEEKVQVALGLGLLNLYSRAEVLGGQFKVISQPGKGTTFIVDIPY